MFPGLHQRIFNFHPSHHPDLLPHGLHPLHLHPPGVPSTAILVPPVKHFISAVQANMAGWRKEMEMLLRGGEWRGGGGEGRGREGQGDGIMCVCVA